MVCTGFIYLQWFFLTRNLQSTASREIRQRNEQFSNKARAGKNPVNASRKEKLAKQSPIGLWALGIILFVVVGGGESLVSCTVLFCLRFGHPQFSLKPLDLSSFDEHETHISYLHHELCALVTHLTPPFTMYMVCPAIEVSAIAFSTSTPLRLASDILPQCQLSSISPPDMLALPLTSALCTPLPVVRPAPDPDAPVISTPSICSDSSCFSSMCTSSPAHTCIVGCHTITTLSSDVLTAVQCSPTPGAQQKSDGRAV